jgi:hypothetical protein
MMKVKLTTHTESLGSPPILIKGAFARKFIPEGLMFAEYFGADFYSEEVNGSLTFVPEQATYMLEVRLEGLKTKYIDASDPGTAGVNLSSKINTWRPHYAFALLNVKFVQEDDCVFAVAIQDIQPEEELLAQYLLETDADDRPARTDPPVFQVEKFLDIKRSRSRTEVKVRWAGYTQTADTWEFSSKLKKDLTPVIYSSLLR